MTEEKQYPNHVIPNSFQTPNIMVDVLLPLLTDPEWRVLSFAMRHILGWREKIEKRKGTISLSMFENGYGPYPGCGLNKGTIAKTLKSLDKFKILEKDAMTRDGQSWQLVEDYSQIDVKALDERLETKQSKNKKRTEGMLQRLQQKRAELLSDNTVGYCGTEQQGIVGQYESNALPNTPLNPKALSLQKQSDAVAADNGDGLYTCVVCKKKPGVYYGRVGVYSCLDCNLWLHTLYRDDDPAIELGSDGRLTEESWDKIEDMDTTDSQWLEQHAVDCDGWGQYTHLTTMGLLQCSKCKSIIGDTNNSGGKYYSRWLSDKPWTPLCPGCWLKRDGTPPVLAFEHGNADDNHKVPTYIIIDKIKYTAERTDHGHIMQLMMRCNCEVGFGDDTDLVVHTLYATEAKGEENISVCLMCNTLVYGRGHSKHSKPPALTAEQAAVLVYIALLDEPCDTDTLRKLEHDNTLNIPLLRELRAMGYMAFEDEPDTQGRNMLWHITPIGRAALEAWRTQQAALDDFNLGIPYLTDEFMEAHKAQQDCSEPERCACGTEITGTANYRAAIDDDDIELVALCDSCEATAAADYKARIDATLKLTESCDSKQLEADEPTLGNTKCIVCSKLVGGDCQCDHLAKQIEYIGNLDNAPVLGARDTTPKQEDDIEVQSIETDEPPPKPKATKAKKKRKTKTPCTKCESKTRKIVEDGKCWECCGYPGRAQMLDLIYDVLGWSKTKTMYGKKNMAHMTRLAQWGATLENLPDYADWMKRYYEKKDWTLVMGSFNKEDMWQTFNAKSSDDDDGLPFGNAPLFADPIPVDPAIIAEAAALSKEEVAALEIKVRKQITGK